MARYQGKLSGPLLDRIDLHVRGARPARRRSCWPAPRAKPAPPCSHAWPRRARWPCSARAQANQQLQGEALEQHLQLEDAAAALLHKAADRLGWSARATHRALRVARTIADLAGSAAIASAHVAEAMQYRRTLRPPAPEHRLKKTCQIGLRAC